MACPRERTLQPPADGARDGTWSHVGKFPEHVPLVGESWAMHKREQTVVTDSFATGGHQDPRRTRTGMQQWNYSLAPHKREGNIYGIGVGKNNICVARAWRQKCPLRK